MAYLGEEFNDDNNVPSQSFELLPDGWYTATISGAELKDTKDKTGNYLNIKYSIVAPTHQGRVVFGMINIRNKSEKAEQIGREQLASLRIACGISKLTDSDQLVGSTVQIKIGTRPETEQYNAQNEIKAYKSAGDNVPAAVSNTTSAAAPSPAKNQGAAPPWAKK